MSTHLEAHRKKASDDSLGLSHQKIYDKAVQLLEKLSSGREHLDFGSGQGVFLSRVRTEIPSLNLTGVDLMAKPKDLHEKISWNQADLNGSLNVADEAYDTVSALEIIEHLENPRHVFRELYRVLKPGGTLILSTPNNESWRSMVSYLKRGHFVAFTDRSYPAHITPLNRKDLLRAADEAGFQFLSWDFPQTGCVPGMTRLDWHSISFGMLKGLRYSDNIFLVLKK